jgi:hypothetical protein
MFQVNTADIMDDRGKEDLPLPRRRYTLTIDSSAYSLNNVEDKTFQTLTGITTFSGDCTVALTYDLPMPLQSRSGFFNVSLRSLAVGQNTRNVQYEVEAGTNISYSPLTSHLTVNIAGASSAYNLKLRDNQKTINTGLVFEEYAVQSYASSASSITKVDQLASGLAPVGTCQLNNNNSVDHVNAQGAGVNDHSLNVPLNTPTRCDDYVVCLPDSVFQSGKLTIVLSSVANIWLNDGVDLDTVLRTDVPLLVNGARAENAQTISYSQYRPFNLPYEMVLSVEEA